MHTTRLTRSSSLRASGALPVNDPTLFALQNYLISFRKLIFIPLYAVAVAETVNGVYLGQQPAQLMLESVQSACNQE